MRERVHPGLWHKCWHAQPACCTDAAARIPSLLHAHTLHAARPPSPLQSVTGHSLLAFVCGYSGYMRANVVCLPHSSWQTQGSNPIPWRVTSSVKQASFVTLQWHATGALNKDSFAALQRHATRSLEQASFVTLQRHAAGSLEQASFAAL